MMAFSYAGADEAGFYRSASRRKCRPLQSGKAEDEQMEQLLLTEHDLLREMRRVRRQSKRKRLAWGLLIWTILAVAAGWYVFSRYYAVAVIKSPAMNDSVLSGSVVLCRRLNGKAPAKGDVILFNQGRTWGLKRVAAKAGDLVALSQKGKLWINGEAVAGYEGGGLDEDLLMNPITVPEGQFFVLGDESAVSRDSRSSAFGTVAQEDVVGVLEYTIWPLFRASNPFQ